MNLLNLQSKIVYGPVNSRRLGRSLGINLLPVKNKICSFDCLYCQYGYTRISPKIFTEEKEYPVRDHIRDAVSDALQSIHPAPAYITFSGNGEATLHPNFNRIVDDIIELRNQFTPQSKTAILSNSSVVDNASVYKALSRLDERIMKFDSATDEMLQKYNRPVTKLKVEQIIAYLKSIPGLTIQALFSGGIAGNADENHINVWVKKVSEIEPKNIQIYTLDRGYPSRNIEPVSQDLLYQIQRNLQVSGMNCDVY